MTIHLTVPPCLTQQNRLCPLICRCNVRIPSQDTKKFPCEAPGAVTTNHIVRRYFQLLYPLSARHDLCDLCIPFIAFFYGIFYCTTHYFCCQPTVWTKSRNLLSKSPLLFEIRFLPKFIAYADGKNNQHNYRQNIGAVTPD